MKALVTAGAGVVFGAWLTSRAQTKRAIVAELHALRAAQALCFSVANKALAIKRQHIRPMKEALDAAIAAHAVFAANPIGPLAIQLDLKTLSQTNFPTTALEKILFDKCFLGGEGVATTVAVSDAADDLKLSIDFRNDLIAEFRKNPPANHQQRLEVYLGLPANGAMDERFKNNVHALFAQANDCIFFARRLGDLILKSENTLRRPNAWKYRLPGTKLKPANWSVAERAGLIPPDADYSDWLKGFVKDPSNFERLKNWLRSLFRYSSHLGLATSRPRQVARRCVARTFTRLSVPSRGNR
jgi:hypothetical protein